MSTLKILSGLCVCTLKEEAAATLSKSRTKGNIKEGAAIKEKDRKSKESQKSKRQTSAKTKTKGSDRSPRLRAPSTPDCIDDQQDQRQGNLELKRSQRQGKTHTDTLYKDTLVFVLLLLCLLCVCVCVFFVHVLVCSLTTFRWVVPANGEVVLKIWFYSDSPGTFEQTYTYELLGTRRHYQLLCRGISTYPSICKDHMSVSIV